MKKLLLILIIAIIAIPVFSTTVLLNGKKMELSLIEVKENNTVFIPLRDLEQIGVGAISQGSDGAIEFITPKMNLLFYKNSDSVKMNSLSLKLPMSTYISNGKFMVPLAFITKSLGGEYAQAEELIVNITNMPTVVKETTLKAPVMEKGTPNTPVLSTDPEKKNSQTTEATKVEEKASEVKTEVKAETKPETKTENVVEKYVAPELSFNWFQGTVMAYNKKLNLIDIDLYNANTNTLVQTTKSNEGAFAFRNLNDGTYFIKIDHEKNPSFRTFKTANFSIKDMEGNKMKKPLNILRAIKSESIKQVKKDTGIYYSVTWSQVPNTKNYKITVKSANPKAKIAKYDAKVETINIPLSDISKGQAYAVTVVSYDAYGNKTGESTDGKWTINTP